MSTESEGLDQQSPEDSLEKENLKKATEVRSHGKDLPTQFMLRRQRKKAFIATAR
jgi:hypothetical protein